MPACFIPAISAIASPLLSTEAAPMGHTRTLAPAFARSRMKRVTEALSFTGFVLGMQQTAVNPPRAAARVPVSIVSEDSCPGSRKWQCRSIKPGAMIRPEASNTSAPWAREIFPGGATSAMRSPSSRMSPGPSVFDWGSTTRPFLMRSMGRVLFLSGRVFAIFPAAADEQEKQRHAHRQAVGHLLEDAGLRAVGDFRSKLDAAVHGAGMQHQCAGFGQFQARRRDLVKKNVIVEGERRFVEPFLLDAQQMHDVGAFERFLDACYAANTRSLWSDGFQFARNPHGRATEREPAAEFPQQVNIRAGHAAVQDVAQDGDVQVLNRAETVADSQRIEQPLGGMLVCAVPRVDDRDIQVAGHEFRRARRAMPHHQTVGLHRAQRVYRVQKRLALFQAGSLRLKVHRVRAEPCGGGAKTDPRARRVLEKRQRHRLPAQRGQLFQGMALDLLKGLALVEKKCDLLRRERLERQKVPKAMGHSVPWLDFTRRGQRA